MAIMGLIAIIGIFAYPLIILRPFIVLTKRNPKPETLGRFSLADLFSLVFLIQLPIGMLNFMDARIREIPVAIFGLMLGAAVIWFAGLRALNHIGVNQPIKRLVGIGFTFPAALIGGFCLPMFVVMATFTFVNGLLNPPATDGPLKHWQGWPGLIWIAVYCLVTFATYSSVRWVIRDSSMERQHSGAPLPESIDT